MKYTWGDRYLIQKGRVIRSKNKPSFRTDGIVISIYIALLAIAYYGVLKSKDGQLNDSYLLFWACISATLILIILFIVKLRLNKQLDVGLVILSLVNAYTIIYNYG